MSDNVRVANNYLNQANAALERGQIEKAAVYASMAQAAVAANANQQFAKIATAIDRLANVVNAGKSWR